MMIFLGLHDAFAVERWLDKSKMEANNAFELYILTEIHRAYQRYSCYEESKMKQTSLSS